MENGYDYNRATSRNLGFWSEELQDKISQSKIALIGNSGDGATFGKSLANAGFRRFVLADPENVEVENFNRVGTAGMSSIGRNKAEVLRDHIIDLNPTAEVDIYTEGVNADNVEDVIHGSDLVIDESEYTYLHIGTMISRAAIRQGIPELMAINVGFAGLSTSFDPNGKHSFETLMGIPNGAPLDEVAEMKLPFDRAVPYIPKYGDYSALKAVMNEDASLPSIGVGVNAAAAIGVTEAVAHIAGGKDRGRKGPTWAPKWRYMDAYENKAGIIRHPRLSFYKGAAQVALRSKLGLNPRVNYTSEDRARRRGE